MHTAWHISELRELFFDQLEPGGLARLAATCKFFFELATDRLWRKLHSVSPFLCCLPPNPKHFTIRDVERLDMYAAKVERISLEMGGHPNPITGPKSVHALLQSKQPGINLKQRDTLYVWRQLWTDIKNLRPHSNFLPNLERFRVDKISEEALLPFVGISGVALRYLCIKIVHPNELTPGLTHEFLTQLRPNTLEHLYIRERYLPDNIPPSIISQSPLKHLRLEPGTIKFPSPKIHLRPEILRKQSLEHLKLALYRDWYSPTIGSMQDRHLGSLKSLRLVLRTFFSARCYQGCVNTEWTCRTGPGTTQPNPTDCGRKSPTRFFELLDRPQLELLDIGFPYDIDDRKFMAVLYAANTNCQLHNLRELTLSINDIHDRPHVTQQAIHTALAVLSPMPHLRVLKLPLASVLPDIIDLDLYQRIADRLPSLTTLWLGRPPFASNHTWGYRRPRDYARTSLSHLAAFCSRFQSLTEVHVECCDGTKLEQVPKNHWVCHGVTSLEISKWDNGQGAFRNPREAFARDLLDLGLRTYFPNSGVSAETFDRPRRDPLTVLSDY